MIVCFTVFGLTRLGLQSCIGELYPALHADSRQVALATDVWRARCAWEALADAVTTPALHGKLRVVHNDPSNSVANVGINVRSGTIRISSRTLVRETI
jgi:hypothetical protein